MPAAAAAAAAAAAGSPPAAAAAAAASPDVACCCGSSDLPSSRAATMAACRSMVERCQDLNMPNSEVVWPTHWMRPQRLPRGVTL